MPSDKIKDPRRFDHWMQWAAVKVFRAKGDWVLVNEFASHAGYLAELRKFQAFRKSLREFPAIAAALEAPPPGVWRIKSRVEVVEVEEQHVVRTKRLLYCQVVAVDAAEEVEKQARRRDVLDSLPLPDGDGTGRGGASC